MKESDAEMWRLKSCPKCKGDIFLEKDLDGWYEECLQCGYTQYLPIIVEVQRQLSGKKRKRALVGAAK